MQVQTFYPENPSSKKYILKTNSPNFNNAYYSFPNTLQSFNIHKNVSCEIKPSAISVYEDKKNRYLTIVQGKYELPLLVKLKGRLDKVTIVFKPLGLNQFIDKPLAEIANGASQVFAEWADDIKYIAFLDGFYKTDDYEERVRLLESFLLSKFYPLKEYDILQKAINQLIYFDKEYTIEEISQSISINTRSFNRLFNKHLGIAPVAFRKIARFRHSLKNKLFSKQFKTLTEIGYESSFYDQSYFIKMYKKLTGDNPSGFFSSVEKLADDQLIFKFITE